MSQDHSHDTRRINEAMTFGVQIQVAWKLNVIRIFRNLCRKTKAGDMNGNHSIGTHSMRKTFSYTYYQVTKDFATLMEIFNHSSMKTTLRTLRYIVNTDESIENSIKSISFF